LDPDPALGTTIGPYTLTAELGHGGFGIVYKAEQQQPIRRTVALKLIKLGMDSREIIARFDAERQALALMDHPNIARILDAGTTGEGQGTRLKCQGKNGAGQPSLDPQPLTLDPCSGRPYFVMELVDGLPLTDYCDAHRLSIRKRLELFITVCQAVQHAHQKGIIHRDLKPSNVMVTERDSAPVVKVIDFGIAKALGASLGDGTAVTAAAQMIGTPLYMSPEQVGLGRPWTSTRGATSTRWVCCCTSC
jgi:serine/threonine protein kinase